MKIKRFNESFVDRTLDYCYIDLYNNPLTESDVIKLHRRGKKIYTINNSYKINEVKDIKKVKFMTNTNKYFPYLLVINESELPIVEKYCSHIKEMEELYNKKLNLLFKHMIGVIQEKNNENNDTEEKG